jgi:cytochrome c553
MRNMRAAGAGGGVIVPMMGRARSGTVVIVLLAAIACAPGDAPPPIAEEPPAWAYPVPPSDAKSEVDDGALRHVPDSDAAFTLTQVRDLFVAPDWHPGDHPAMPPVVANGRKPDVYACGFCHRAEGTGGPENASLAGLPAAYIVQQMADFKSGARATSAPDRLPPKYMIEAAKAATDAEVKAAAAYFASLRPRANIKVVESDVAPKTFVTSWHLAAQPNGETEPLGVRIVEVPADLDQFVSRDSRAQFVAYAPIGSLRRGRELVTTGAGGRTVRCADCHGADLRGLEAVPGIAGRSPTYVVRQLYDFKHRGRAGAGLVRMLPTVSKLTIDDMIAIAAYTASLKP